MTDIEELKRLAQKATKRIADRVNPIFYPSSLPPETVNLSYCANCRSASDPEFIHTCAYGCKAKLHSGCVLNHNWDFHREEVYESDTNIVAANPQTILALIERLEALEEAVKGAHVIAEQAGEALRANKGTVRLTLKHLEALVEAWCLAYPNNRPFGQSAEPPRWLTAAIKEAQQ